MADAAQISATNERLPALTDRRARAGRGHAARRSRAPTELVSVVGLVGTFAAGASPAKRRAATVPAAPGSSTSTVAPPTTTTTTIAPGAS